MKLNLEIDISDLYIDEETDLTTAVKSQIRERIVSEICGTIMRRININDVQNEVAKELREATKKRVEQITNTDDWMSRENIADAIVNKISAKVSTSAVFQLKHSSEFISAVANEVFAKK